MIAYLTHQIFYKTNLTGSYANITFSFQAVIFPVVEKLPTELILLATYKADVSWHKY